jgi:phosphomannomutase
MTSDEQLIKTAQDWVAQDFDEANIAELTKLITAAQSNPSAVAELATRFSGPLKFGTAGLRAKTGAGESQMNRASVAKAAFGVATWMQSQQYRTLVVGNDARTGSNAYATDTCKIAAALGLTVIRLENPLPTPVLAYALTKLKADAAIMVTASHNPASDNGYKVYDKTGSQIISPTDEEIAELISTAPKANQIDRSGAYQNLAMIEEYVDFVASKALYDLSKDVKIAYTALHGVGSVTFNKLMKKLGYLKIFEVDKQQLPDPNFPTVKFPNPEEDGAMELVLEVASANQVDVVIANDPDADRTAVAVPTKSGWRVLTGDELGTLLAWWCIKRRELNGEAIAGAMAASIVSGSMCKRIAEAHGLKFFYTLTGFKYVSRVPELIFGYEEAIGYAVLPAQVKDKDGISAALFAVEFISYLKSQNSSAVEQLESLYSEFGTVLTKQITLRLDSIEAVTNKLNGLIANLPSRLGTIALQQIENFADGIDSLPKSNGIKLNFNNGRVIIRPSGTEPKLKCYVEVFGAPTKQLATQQGELQDLLVELTASLTELFAT